ncbi:unnamed protein product, partial [marine sediment metagenome]
SKNKIIANHYAYICEYCDKVNLDPVILDACYECAFCGAYNDVYMCSQCQQ